jgi:hypothetical protein
MAALTKKHMATANFAHAKPGVDIFLVVIDVSDIVRPLHPDLNYARSAPKAIYVSISTSYREVWRNETCLV